MTAHAPSPPPPPAAARGVRPRLGVLKRLMRLGLILIAVLVVWFAAVRLTAGWRMVRVIDDEAVPRFVERAPDQPVNERRPRTLRIGTWNIAHGLGPDGGLSPEESRQRIIDIARVIAEADLDIVILNQVDFDATWSGRVNQAELIARESGYRYRVEQRNVDMGLPFFALRFGNAVLSRYPIAGARAVDFPWYNLWEPILAGKKRGCLATIELPAAFSSAPRPAGAARGPATVQVAAIHLDHRWHGDEARDESLRNLIAARDSSQPLIAAGDFNMSLPGFPMVSSRRQISTPLSEFMAALDLQTVPMSDPQPYDMTFRAPQPQRVIDWILVPKGWTIISRSVLRSDLSDHLPLVMEVEVGE